MGTQAVISIVKDGAVVAKIIAGCDGYNAPMVADQIVEFGINYDEVPTVGELRHFAIDCGLGCADCLVVMDGENCTMPDVDERYRRTFEQPLFNPRWEAGTAAYTIVVDANSWTAEVNQ